MLKKIFIGLIITLTVGSALVFAGYSIRPFTASANDDNATQKQTLTLEAFENINITVTAANISFVRGDSYQVEYVLNADEKIKTLEVTGNTLVFESNYENELAFNFNFSFFNWPSFSDIKDLTPDEDYQIIVTIPQDANLSDIKLTSVSGNIVFNDEQINNLNLDTVSGIISTKNIISDSMLINAVSSNIDVVDCIITDFNSNAVSSNTTISGEFENINIATISGNCELNGNVSNSVDINTVSGNIAIDTNKGSVTANTFGEIRYNGDKQGSTFSATDGEANFKINNTSGDITITMK